MKFRVHAVVVALSILTLAVVSTAAHAGCGCEKPAPVLAEVRPNTAYAGLEVSLFHPDFEPGNVYDVVFSSSITGETAVVEGEAVTRRDLSDGVLKPQIVVRLPELPLGPTQIDAVDATGAELLSIDDAAFTVVPLPVVVPDEAGKFQLQHFQAAVGRDGVVYLSLDLSEVTDPKVIQAQAKGYGLRFTGDDVVFYNSQGFLMQLLDGSIPGLFAVAAPDDSATDSDLLRYSRHEFNSFFLQHDERQVHDVDAEDPNWHLDGTRHIDHNYLIVAIAGTFEDGSLPAPGSTPEFKLEIRTTTLFSEGVIGDVAVEMKGRTVVDGYDSSKGEYGSDGRVRSNDTVELSDNAKIQGDAVAERFIIRDKAEVTGELIASTTSEELLPVYFPQGLENLGTIELRSKEKMYISGPGSFEVGDLILKDRSRLFVDNSAGPVTLYVTGMVELKERARIETTESDPEWFALYVTGGSVEFEGSSSFYGVVYAPEASIDLAGGSELYGAFVGRTVLMSENAAVHYDLALRKKEKVDTKKLTTSSPSDDSDTGSVDSTDTKGKGKGKGRKKK